MGLSIPSTGEARGRGQPSLELSAAGFTGQRPGRGEEFPDTPLTCTRRPGHLSSHSKTCETAQGPRGLTVDIPGFTARPAPSCCVTLALMFPSSEAQSVYSPEQWERMTLGCEDSKMSSNHTTGIFSQTYFFYILAISEDYNQCNNKTTVSQYDG